MAEWLTKPSLGVLLARFWTIVLALCVFFLLMGIVAGRRSSAQADLPKPPRWPESVVYDQEIIEDASYHVADYCSIFYHWPTRSWFANHTNLFNSHCHADLLWLNRTMYTLFPANGRPYGNLSCCLNVNNPFSGLSVHPPDWTRGHWYVGEQEMYGVECEVFYSTVMASTIWVAKNSSRTPVRWDNNSGVMRGGGSQLVTAKFDNFRVGPIDMNVFIIPPECANPPPCPPYAALVNECNSIWNITT